MKQFIVYSHREDSDQCDKQFSKASTWSKTWSHKSGAQSHGLAHFRCQFNIWILPILEVFGELHLRGHMLLKKLVSLDL